MLRTAVRMIGVGGALLAGVATAPSAWAQCTNTLPGVIVGGSSINASSFVPLAQGGAVNSIVSVLNTVNTSYLTSTSAFVSAPGNPQPDQQGSGAWARGISGSVETENTGRATATALGANVPGSVNCNTTTQTDFTGYQVGHDISVLNGGATGANFHVGVTAGYVEIDAKDKELLGLAPSGANSRSRSRACTQPSRRAASSWTRRRASTSIRTA